MIKNKKKGYSHLDEIDFAISLAFEEKGERIYGGYKNNVKIFDLNVPGREISTIKTFERRNKKSFGYQGIIGSIDLQSNSHLVACGSYQKKLGVWDQRTCKMIKSMKGHTGGNKKKKKKLLF